MRERLIVMAVMIAAAAAMLAVRARTLPALRAPDGHYVLADPDSYMRWRLVQRAMDGGSVRIRWVPDDNSPYGRINEWTSPMTICGLVAANVLGKDAGVWLGPVMGVLSLVALGLLGYKAGGWRVSVCWMAAWPVLMEVWRVTQCGNVDHHSLHLLLFILTVGGAVAGCGGVFVGLASAVGLWAAGSEFLPVWVMVAGLGVWEMSRPEGRSRHGEFWRAWWGSGLAAETAAWVFEFWPGLFHGQLEFLSVWHVGLWVIAGVLLEFLRREERRSRQWMGVLTAVMLAVFSAGAARGFDWRRLHVVQDELFRRQLMLTVEFGGFGRGGWRAFFQAWWWGFGLLPVLMFLGWGKGRQRWVVVVAAVFLTLMLREARWAMFFAVAVVMVAGLAVCARWPRRGWWVVLAATLPCWWQVFRVPVVSDPMRGPYATTFVMEAVSDCLGHDGRRPVVLATWDQGAVLAGMGKVRVIGSGYWSNAEGLRAGHELFSTKSPERFWELVREREVEYFLVPPPEMLAGAIGDSTLIMGERAPSLSEVKQTVAWQVASRGDFPVVTCERMARVASQGFILQLRVAGTRPLGNVGGDGN